MTFLLLSIFLAILAMGYDCPFIGPEGTMPKGPQFPPALRLRDALDPLLGYKIVAPIWVGLTGEDEEKVTFEGTVQEAFDQLRRLKSNASNITFATETVHNDKAYCYIAGPGAKGMAPQGQVKADANNYLRHLGGSLHMPPGPRICSRVSCSWCSGIWLVRASQHQLLLRYFLERLECSSSCFLWE